MILVSGILCRLLLHNKPFWVRTLVLCLFSISEFGFSDCQAGFTRNYSQMIAAFLCLILEALVIYSFIFILEWALYIIYYSLCLVHWHSIPCRIAEFGFADCQTCFTRIDFQKNWEHF